LGKRSPKRLPWGCCYIAVIFGVVFFFAGGFVYLSVGGYPSAEYRADYPMWYLEQQEKRLKEIGSTLGSLLGLSLASFVAAAVFAYFSWGEHQLMRNSESFCGKGRDHRRAMKNMMLCSVERSVSAVAGRSRVYDSQLNKSHYSLP